MVFHEHIVVRCIKTKQAAIMLIQVYNIYTVYVSVCVVSVFGYDDGDE